MPVGKVKWYDPDKGFGFVSNPDGDDVYVGKAVLPEGVDELSAGQRIEFDFAETRKKPQALRVAVLDSPRRRRAARRRPAEELNKLVADLMTVLETEVQPALEHGRYPDRAHGRQVAQILRAVARELDA